MRPIMIGLLAVAATTGCATRRYVSREVGETNAKVDSLASNLEKTQDRIQRNEVTIDAVSRRSQAGIAEATASAHDAYAKAATAETAAKGKLIYSITLSNDRVTFPFDAAKVGDDAKRTIDEAIAPLKAENRGVYLEIEGHTDSTGPEEYNLRLGEQRAIAVRNYLHDEQGIPLSRMAVLSSGSSRPVIENDTPEHRAQNRRVVINVLE